MIFLNRFIYASSMAWYQDRIAKSDPARLEFVGTRPALVVDGSEDRPTVVEFVYGDDSSTAKDGVEVSIYGHNLTAQKVKEIAASVTPA